MPTFGKRAGGTLSGKRGNEFFGQTKCAVCTNGPVDSANCEVTKPRIPHFGHNRRERRSTRQNGVGRRWGNRNEPPIIGTI
jgi:hypothetical protein